MTRAVVAPAERLRTAAAGVAHDGRSRAAMLELFLAIREAHGDGFARWSRKLASPLDAFECAAVVWERLMARPSELAMLAEAADPCAWLGKAATHEPTAGEQRSNGWLFDYADGYGTSRATIEEWDEPPALGTDLFARLHDEEERVWDPLTVIEQRVLGVLLVRTPPALREAVSTVVPWMVDNPLSRRAAKAYVARVVELFPVLSEDEVRNLVTVVWGPDKRKDMSLLGLFARDRDANIIDHGPVYRAVTMYRQRMHGQAKRPDPRKIAA